MAPSMAGGWGGGVLPETKMESNALWWPKDVKFEV